MGCDQGIVNENCASRQSFCELGHQSVESNAIDYNLFNNYSIIQNQTIISDDIWNRIYTVLQNIYNYGELGTRNPLNLNSLSHAQDGSIMTLSLYTNILSKLGLTNNESDIVITKQLMERLQDDIKTYKLNLDRCNSCNTECNNQCEAESQGCDYVCYCAQYDCEHGGCPQSCGDIYM